MLLFVEFVIEYKVGVFETKFTHSGHVTPQPHFNATDEAGEMSPKYLAINYLDPLKKIIQCYESGYLESAL